MSRQVFFVNGPDATPAVSVSLASANLRERRDLGEWVINHPEVLGDDVMVVTSEFDQWATDSGSTARDRLDVLGLDASGRLVVVELKRDGDRNIHVQALTYAALVAGFDVVTLAGVHADFLTKRSGYLFTPEQALDLLSAHVEGEFDPVVLSVPRIVLLAGDHPPQVVTSTVWLTSQGLDIELREVKAWMLGEQVVVTFDQVYPVPGVVDLLLGPARRQASDAVKKADERARSASAVRIIVESELIPDGTVMLLHPCVDVPLAVREQVLAWVSKDRSRGQAVWVNDVGGPLRWAADGGLWKPTTLVRHILKQAAGVDRAIRGTSWWLTPDGVDLASAAGINGSSSRDWSDVHALLGVVSSGEWVTFGDVGSVVNLPAQIVQAHITCCVHCFSTWRVLTDDGVPAGFNDEGNDAGRASLLGCYWRDPKGLRTHREVLDGEGLTFDEFGAAVQVNRLSSALLRERCNGL